MELLVSVRSVEEAEAALLGGAAVIDVKEPTRGSLGRADATTIAAVVAIVAGQRTVSAALGELSEGAAPCAGIQFAKWGLAGLGNTERWPTVLRRAAAALPESVRPVAVAYADWERAAAPPPAAVCSFACAESWPAFLVDTAHKDGSTLLDWLSMEELTLLRQRCYQSGVRLALAGSLGPAQIRQLRPLRPDWFAIRGAACRAGRRDGTIDSAAVRGLRSLLDED